MIFSGMLYIGFCSGPKCPKIDVCWGFVPQPTGHLQHYSGPLARFRGKPRKETGKMESQKKIRNKKEKGEKSTKQRKLAPMA